MKINFVSIFPNLIAPYFEDSILKRAIDRGIVEISFINPRDFSKNRYRKVDLPLIGGGAGMLMTIQPLVDALNSIEEESRIIALSPTGKKFTQKDAIRFAKFDSITLISGRYEGVDERIVECCIDEVISIGDYILTGGEVASLVVADATIRNLEGVLGNSESLEGESFENYLLESPNFAKPVDGVPSIYLSGNHKKVGELRNRLSELKTQFFRPDLYQKYQIYQKGKR